MYLRSKGASIAKDHEALVQAICNFRAETGLLPYELEDLQKRYKIKIPPHVFWSSAGVLDVRAGTPRISYVFGDDYEGWSSHWGDLSDAPITPAVQQVAGERRIDAALTEYDRRIEEYENDRWHRSAKMALLASLDRRNDVYTECVAALEEHPEWWRANFGVAMYAPDSLRSETESQFRQWVERTPSFVHWWYLAKYYRERDRRPDALQALQEAATYPLEQVDDDAGTVPHGFAFDAASYACKQGAPNLVLALCDAWAKPKGVYNYPSPDLPAFRAAAFLNLGQRDQARVEVAKFSLRVRNVRYGLAIYSNWGPQLRPMIELSFTIPVFHTKVLWIVTVSPSRNPSHNKAVNRSTQSRGN